MWVARRLAVELAQLADDAAASGRLGSSRCPSRLEDGRDGRRQQGPARGAARAQRDQRPGPTRWPRRCSGTPTTATPLVWVTYSPAYEGPIGHVHGGFVVAAFDDLMGMGADGIRVSPATPAR